IAKERPAFATCRSCRLPAGAVRSRGLRTSRQLGQGTVHPGRGVRPFITGRDRCGAICGRQNHAAFAADQAVPSAATNRSRIRLTKPPSRNGFCRKAEMQYSQGSRPGQADGLMGEGTMAVDEAKSPELIARLEPLPFSRWHRNFFILGFLGIMFDAADSALFGAALPPIAKEFGLGPAQSGLLATAGLIGAFVGALFWGTLSDYIGRRTSFQATVGIFAVFTGLVAASWSV